MTSFYTFNKGTHRTFSVDRKGSLKALKLFTLDAQPVQIENINRVQQLFSFVSKAKSTTLRSNRWEKIVLFCSDDYDTPLWLKSLAVRFYGNLIFAETRAKNKIISSQVGVKEFPSLVLMDNDLDLDSPTNSGILLYPGPTESSNDEADIVKWLNLVAKPAGWVDSSMEQSKNLKK